MSFDQKTYLREWYQRNKYPEGFRVLCMNCNLSYGAHGYCPHKITEEKQ